jgi:hypothetical protein
MTKKGSFIPKVSFLSIGEVIKAVLTFVPMISKTEELMSLSVILLMYPFWICSSQI